MDGSAMRRFVKKEFGIHCLSIVPVKYGVYRMVAKDGRVFGLKRMRYDHARLLWMDHALATVKTQGFHAFSWGTWKYPKGELYPFLLMDWLDGQMADPFLSEDLRVSANVLAKFHQAGSNLRVRGHGEFVTLGSWLQQYRRGLQLLEQSRRENWPFLRQDGVSLEVYHTLEERAHRAIDVLKKHQYEQMSLHSSGVLCHGDSGPANFIISRGQAQLIDFETLRIDAPSYDLFRMIRLTSKQRGYEGDWTQDIIHGYTDMASLSDQERQFVLAWMMYPYKVCKLLRHYSTVSTTKRKQVEKKLIRAIKREKNQHVLVKQLRRALDV
ncbi:phosphotransferase [Sulfoacidibacillus ferrooxidans]|uniref:Aminoglycoside phosphotransferase domain-containing protein n=1 Tax=Sulfoacidibacillus ferrooxidans TaxID=2005001 RepID=A0A9X1V711_9BACL|nr:phosphotransferase [Sulfoacidibacillus ferrooxidans]MCI0181985.1 hypothetical protein [Sulfoacidibacillus ferrooxidans]